MTRGARMACWSVFLRSFAIQGSWNYRTMLGAGFAFALLPVLREVYRGNEDALNEATRRHSNLFNSHPYLATMALGAVAALELDRAAAQLIERFKAAMRGPLGALGDRLVWAGWLPASLLLALVLYCVGTSGWLAAVVFLGLYNVGHLILRLWGFRLGLQKRNLLGEPLRHAGLARLGDRIAGGGAFLLGALVALLLIRGVVDQPVPYGFSLLGLLGVVLGVWRGEAVRRQTAVALLVTAFAILAYGWAR
ncbi:MAG: PTS system mannose/fructose/sorbose family transporter subunit IID [Gemmatimonadetes bacterium]|nr:PTS system mannose/fructose/sorbose family transporter subunit IID [Gemmatimonadota bacterium]